MDNNKQLTDKELRDLLKRRLMEQSMKDDQLNQKLTDMEAQLAFGTEALHVPSLQKEQELLNGLKKERPTTFFRKWLPLLGIPALVLLSLVIWMLNSKPVASDRPEKPSPQESTCIPAIQTHTIQSTDSTAAATISTIVMHVPQEIIAADSAKKETERPWTAGDPGIRTDIHPASPKPVKYIDPYEHIPVLSEKERAWTKKSRESLVKGIWKHDKKMIAYVPASTEVIYGDTVSVNGFYMFTGEISNNTYRIFLNDLIMQDKIDEFLKAVPDTSKWMIGGKAFYEPMRKNYYWHPAYDDFPVLNVSREGAKMFCDWLTMAVNDKIKDDNSKEKAEALYINDIRIPAEEEWMIAARGGRSDVAYPWTNADRKGIQNGKGCYMCNFSIINFPDSLKQKVECANDKLRNAITSAGSVSGDLYFTAKIYSYNPNDYGLYCICGNASEMVWQYKTKKACAKGGSWNSDAENVKIDASPELMNVTEGSPYLGFRPVFTFRPKK